jgi:predicted nucleotidyltransferase
MDKKRIDTIIQHLAGELQKSGVTISSVRLFGSCAGTASYESDIDIAVVSPDFREYEFSKQFHLLGSAIIQTIRQYHTPIDVIPLTPVEYECEQSLRMDFIRQGIEITVTDQNQS